ncbi:cobyric acid synthase [Methanospirillum stamsii]|uniref:Probable cobyric acid synthase n=1 Tax=Methanospirillum stamsii TaxID=1277351 RepID=A0A2V2NGV4_9EURY|nr:cobyric acid synthase [Methanospirillum stamsii]PWR75618.1 cobyric acid synthase CobQ [Methanospirillum stamsii]
MSVMVLGTASHVGKSTIVAAICRILHRHDRVAAPFKSQNMSLNSWVTEDGGEIGIAQAMQAHAACLKPSIHMNPILLKPKGDQSSQIILLGKPYTDVHAKKYYQLTDNLLEIAVESAKTLLEQFGALVVEGAGGAAEVNLYDRDIANIGLARKLKFPIILVADIERGGVFAQVYGTISLLPDDIRPLVKGVIVNKFRGDPSLFSDGMKILDELTGVPTLGLIPMTDIDIPSEDSLSLSDKKNNNSPIRIAIIKFPRISNFTDYELLERYASVTYVNPGDSLKGYDAIILPGTKNTIEDLQEIQNSGTTEEIIQARAAHIPIVGICGGYQMLCEKIIDSGVESKKGEYKGIGLIPCTTTFSEYQKTTVQVTRRSSGYGPFLQKVSTVSGYEIHMGETDTSGMKEAFSDEGVVSEDGLLIGTYMHGLFTSPEVAGAFVSFLCERKGISWEMPEHLTDPYDALADHVEKHVKIEEIIKFFN